MNPQDDRYRDQIDALEDFSAILKVYMDKIGACYITTEVHGDDISMMDNGQALIYTALTFEVLINSLMSQELVTPDDTFLSMLSHITLTLGSLNELSRTLMLTIKKHKQEIGEYPDDDEMERRAKELLGEDIINRLTQKDIEIPDIFKQAFGELDDNESRGVQ
tara:strand:+ start:836 stop:1324 length:489 start_codon:yes stop_codon:yes gene_type:complete